jgi:adenine-specific DNA-methyltransferase
LKIVKQYQFDKWSTIKQGAFISEKNLFKVINKKSDRYNKIMRDKILIAEDALEITASLDTEYRVPQGGIYFGSPYDDDLSKTKILLGALNSRLLSRIYEFLFGGMHMGGGYLRYRSNFLDNLPVNKSLFNIDTIRYIVDYILFSKKENKDSTFFESLIDAMVYELYFPDEIKAADCKILKHLTNLPELKDNWNDEEKLAAIEKVHKELSGPTHPVSIAMTKMRDIPEIRIIEGAK